MQAWYLVYTKPQQERLAVENLGRQDFETYLPVLWNRRRRARKSVARLEPMFPRYLFIHLDDSTDDWGPIRSTVGVANMVRFANRAAKVPDALIATLQSREDGEGVQQLERCALARGERVRIEEGPFAGYEALFEAVTSQSRVLILLDIAGKQARIKIDENSIEAV